MSATSDTSRMAAGSTFGGMSAQMEARIGMMLAGAGAIIAVAAAIFYLVLALQWRGQPFIGALLTRSLTVDGSQPLNVGTWSGLKAGLQRGDQIVGLNTETLPTDPAAAEQEYDALIRSMHVGQSVKIAFERPAVNGAVMLNHAEVCDAVSDGFAHCEVSFVLTGLPDIDFLAFFIVPFVSGLITLGVGIGVLMMRSRKPSAQVVSAVCLTMGVFMMGIFDINTSRQIVPLWIIGTTFAGAATASMAFIFPEKLPIVYRHPAIQWLPMALGALVSGAILVSYYNPPSPQDAVSTVWLPPLIGLFGMAVLVAALLRRRESAPAITIRDQSNTVLIGLLLSLVLGVIWVLNLIVHLIAGYDLIPLNTSAAMPFLILPPLSMAYAVLQYRSLDTDRIISQALTYTVMLVGLIVGYFLLLFSVTLIAGQFIGAGNPILLAVVIFLMAVLFIPVRTRLQARVDKIYYRKRQNFQAEIESFGQRLSALIEFGDIIDAYRTELNNMLLPLQVFIFLPDRQTGEYIADGTDVRFAADSPLIQALAADSTGMMYLESGQPWPTAAVAERSRLRLLKASILAGLHGSNRLSGFACIAPPRSMSGRYTFEELRFVQTLTTQISVAVERAEVVDSLEHRVRELDVLSQVSAAVNYTIDLDDLLELIYAQSARLIDATNFYITLRDPATSELYHAFFLEDGERYEDKENQRWALGKDMFSQIVRSGQPLWVSNYAAALAERDATTVNEDPNLKSWMGVPLLAGARTIGVIATGTTQANKTYTGEQRKIFSDIGTLAATSIDKARLFAETNVRARQLSALNDITRQIVTAELDLDKLLQLITESVTDILDAEAGSLLLSVDDGSGDLEFRVAVGGSGSDLVGNRLHPGVGLVGQVASTGQPVIVNDVKKDPRWSGELSGGAFRTNTVVAVPLMTQNTVIGVLEVLNKKGGSAFSREDIDLLTAFAGQAAVAIENARLFQMTDLQLTERVSELETLERIDVELNRSLDLLKVAEISLHWAMENSSAAAGLIGVVVGEPPRLDVVYRVGYEAEDAPVNAEGNLWPLERGIVSRVLRTKQPDLVPDVRIDPNYIPSLRGALSQITIPMLSGGTINAIMVLETNREPRLRLADMPFLQRLAEHASIAIANAQLYAELTRANQSKSEFVSFVAHELKNPLTSIRGYSDVLLKGAVGGMSDQQRNFLDTIRSNADRMNTLVSDLNDVTKLQTDNMRMELGTVDFRKALTETLRPFEQQIEAKGQTLELTMADTVPAIRADQNRLIQVMTNLVSNAHKYTPENGLIRLKAQVLNAPRDNKGRLLPPMLQVSVTDTGIGMSEEDLNRLFTPYFRSDNPLTREQPGTGLGLTITRGIIERHGGTIWVESELGKGTTFNFTVPLAAQAERQAGD